MARRASKQIHSEEFPIEQKPSIEGDELPARGGDIVIVDRPLFDDEAKMLEFMNEPVTIRMEGSRDKNAATSVPIWCNGKGAEALIADGRFVRDGGRWREVTWLPVNTILTIKRKYLAILASAKLDEVTTDYDEVGVARPRNKINRMTYAFQSFTVIEDKNPKGRAWLEEIRRRNFG